MNTMLAFWGEVFRAVVSDLPEWIDVRTALLAASVFVISVVWKYRKHDKKTVRAFTRDSLASLGLTVGATVLALLVATIFYYPAKVYSNKSAEVEALAKQSQPVEPENSLRRRTIRLANGIDRLWEERQATHPPYASGSLSADATPEQRRVFETSIKYDEETERLCLERFREEILGVPRELRLKGLEVYWLDKMEVRCLQRSDSYGGGETQLLRHLAYRLDESGNLLRIPN